MFKLSKSFKSSRKFLNYNLGFQQLKGLPLNSNNSLESSFKRNVEFPSFSFKSNYFHTSIISRNERTFEKPNFKTLQYKLMEQSGSDLQAMKRLRNIGISAHIDSGKTTGM